MTRLWRLTRNRYGRAAYDALARAGITATWMYEYTRSLTESVPEPADTGVTVERCDPARVAPLDPPVDDLVAGEDVVAAVVDGTPAGYLFCSVGATHHIDPLDRRLSFDGAYIRRVFVDPDCRNRGVATAMVAAACRHAADDGAAEATALVALDNRPSRALFERLGFRAARTRRYAAVGPLSWRSVRVR
ncbi:GNAT family N-acetyltransferase [Haloarcula sp. Atlit-7R]|uniref:GNAT family N-acetyltransferase n=1 Tax=Haloarcula sp. Atlit-7R TaxID=2282125 RepID=UPI000EF15098|nr:GNAT family N-acetyltransferase [Haloarcula sp. Atlit-7R]RLM96331.1 GNAT family N-acetyltransferase [Haloarcula sp. Atlit-7R]